MLNVTNKPFMLNVVALNMTMSKCDVDPLDRAIITWLEHHVTQH
jgi:hypothetical protein